MSPANRFQDPRYGLAVALIIATALVMQFAPRPWNVAPMGALALFAGAYLPRAYAIAVPTAILFAATMVTTGPYNPVVMASVFGGFAASALIGRALLFRRRSPLRLAGGVLGGALLFFVVTNFAVWAVYEPHTLERLAHTYVRAIPFFGRSLVGDAVYAVIFFGTMEALAKAWRLPDAPRPQRRA